MEKMKAQKGKGEELCFTLDASETEGKRGWFLVHLGRLSGMCDKMLEKAQVAHDEVDARKALNQVEEIESNTEKFILQAAMLRSYAHMWKLALREEVRDLE